MKFLEDDSDEAIKARFDQNVEIQVAIIKQLVEDKTKVITLSGHSAGCHTTTEVANQLKEEGYKIEDVLLISPVAFTKGTFLKLLNTDHNLAVQYIWSHWCAFYKYK
ncbi:MAG: alpha/beta hydrolase [Candidatus Dojkabacteria bacterium]|nr:alpha/beta hydrolase [Candidatus Dojkabacteria bacterium]